MGDGGMGRRGRGEGGGIGGGPGQEFQKARDASTPPTVYRSTVSITCSTHYWSATGGTSCRPIVRGTSYRSRPVVRRSI